MKHLRILSALLALLLVFSLFAGCSKKESSAKKPTNATTAPSEDVVPESTADPGCDDDVTNPPEDPTDPEASTPDTTPDDPTSDVEVNIETTEPENTESGSQGGTQSGNQGGTESGTQSGTQTPETDKTFTFAKTDITLQVKDGAYKLYTGTAPVAEISWESSDETLCTFIDGVITPVAPGVVTVKATYKDKTLECTVRIMDGGNVGSTGEIDFDDLLNAGR